MPQDFRVVPESLQRASVEMQQVADGWANARTAITQSILQQDEIGLMGYAFDVAKRYNEAQAKISDEMVISCSHLQDAAIGLTQMANFYMKQDYDYYRQFGYIETQP